MIAVFSARLQHPKRIRVGGYGPPIESTLLQGLLGASGTHDEAITRVKERLAMYTEPEAACFEPEMARAVLEGRKTVSRWPVESTSGGELLPAPFRVGGGPGGSYVLQESTGSSWSPRTIVGYRLRVLNVEIGTIGLVSLDEVRLEGFERCITHAQYWNSVRLENDLFGLATFRDLLLWRYEFELLEL